MRKGIHPSHVSTSGSRDACYANAVMKALGTMIPLPTLHISIPSTGHAEVFAKQLPALGKQKCI